jgi:hypothetical protein
VHAFRERPYRLFPRRAFGPLARHVTPADMYVHRWGLVADAPLDQPVRHRRAGLDAAPAFGLTAPLSSEAAVHVEANW